jgi:hypothetical protein
MSKVLCPIARAVGCKKCPIFKVCLVKGIIGDYKGGGKTETPVKIEPVPRKKK